LPSAKVVEMIDRAAGEISAEEYQRARDILRGDEPPKP